jgi:hypothetical protein
MSNSLLPHMALEIENDERNDEELEEPTSLWRKNPFTIDMENLKPYIYSPLLPFKSDGNIFCLVPKISM